ncbi:MAG: magnesium/cobalt transporter CorA [Flavobacteriales bacterium]|nr:magnesium/cobalt transporter CorA [Flavobacteriales bacterium]
MSSKQRNKARSRSAKAGLPPGALILIGKQREEEVSIELIEFSEGDVHEAAVDDINGLHLCTGPGCVSWVNVNGIHDPEVIRKLGEVFGIHALVLEDVLNTDHRPKVEFFEDHVFFTMKMMWFGDDDVLEAEQVSIVFGDHYVLSFQERKGDLFEPTRERIRQNTGVVRKKGADFLVYRLIDIVVDNYFTIMERFDEKLDDLEERITADNEGDHIAEIQAVKREMLRLRRSLLPLREAVSALEKGVSGLVLKNNQKYFKDVYDHLVQLSDSLESNREVLGMLMDLYLANMSNRMNNVMKVLTIVSTIFIPLTFIAGIYGMNFEHMPELGWRNGYFITLGVMAALAAMMLVFFRRKRWL